MDPKISNSKIKSRECFSIKPHFWTKRPINFSKNLKISITQLKSLSKKIIVHVSKEYYLDKRFKGLEPWAIYYKYSH